MLLSKIVTPYHPRSGKGTIGRNYSYQTCSTVTGFFDNESMNPFIGGSAVMGASPATSPLNPWLQSWEAQQKLKLPVRH